MPKLPSPRGMTSALLVEHLGPEVTTVPAHWPVAPADPLADEDLQLALYVFYELHYRGFDGGHPEWEWEPSLLTLRRHLERIFETALLDAVGPPVGAPAPEDFDLAL